MARPGDFSQGFGQVPRRAAEGFLGQIATDSQLRRYSSGINRAPQLVEVWTLNVNADPGDDITGTVTFDFGQGPCAVTFNTGTGAADATAIAVIIAAAINAEPLVYGRATASNVAALITLTGRTAGQVFTVTEAESYLDTPTNTQNALDADDVEVARGVIETGFNDTNVLSGIEDEQLVALAASSLFTAQVQTLTVATGATGDRHVQVYAVRGDERVLVHSDIYQGSATATVEATNFRAAINSGPASFVVATGATDQVIVTAEVPGLEFVVQVDAVGTTSAETAGPSPATSLNRAWAGIATYTLSDEALVVGGTVSSYPANHGVRYIQEGAVIVASTEVIPRGAPVFVELAAGADTGKFFTTGGAGTTRVGLGKTRAKWERRTRDGLDFGRIALAYQA